MCAYYVFFLKVSFNEMFKFSGKTKGPGLTELRGKLIDDSDNIEETVGALSEAVKEEFQVRHS